KGPVPVLVVAGLVEGAERECDACDDEHREHRRHGDDSDHGDAVVIRPEAQAEFPDPGDHPFSPNLEVVRLGMATRFCNTTGSARPVPSACTVMVTRTVAILPSWFVATGVGMTAPSMF